MLGLIAIVIYFQIRNSLFLSAGNLVNLMTQAAFIVTFGMAEVFVLLLGEIDLSVGYQRRLRRGLHLLAAVPAESRSAGGSRSWSAWPSPRLYGARGRAHHLAAPAVVRGHAGRLARRAGPAAALIDLAAPGGGTIRLSNNVLLAIEGGAMSPAASWIVMIVAVVLAGGLFMMLRDTRRRAHKLAAPPAQRDHG